MHKLALIVHIHAKPVKRIPAPRHAAFDESDGVAAAGNLTNT